MSTDKRFLFMTLGRFAPRVASPSEQPDAVAQKKPSQFRTPRRRTVVQDHASHLMELREGSDGGSYLFCIGCHWLIPEARAAAIPDVIWSPSRRMASVPNIASEDMSEDTS
jgi:hypothetical protein